MAIPASAMPFDVEGVAFGDAYTVAEKRAARVGVELDQRIEARGLETMPAAHAVFSDLWSMGRADLGWSPSMGDVVVYFTAEQKKALTNEVGGA
jgi:hypothetical protein